jgi:hypothetical protein
LEKNLKDRKRKLDDKEEALTKEEKELSEELKTAEKLYHMNLSFSLSINCIFDHPQSI